MSTAYYEKALQEDLNVGVEAATKRNPGGGQLTGTQIGIHTIALGQAATSATWDPGSIASGASESTDVTVSGAALGDFVLASFSLDVQDMILSAEVSAANTVTATLSNLSGASPPPNLSSGTLRVLVLKSA